MNKTNGVENYKQRLKRMLKEQKNALKHLQHEQNIKRNKQTLQRQQDIYRKSIRAVESLPEPLLTNAITPILVKRHR